MLTKEEIKYKISGLRFEFENGTTKFVLDKTKLTVPRYLTRQLELGTKHGWADHQIRDLALEIETELQPPTIKYCETPEDYVTMYHCGGYSCMKVGCYSHLGAITKQIYDDHKLWPTIWYHYNPHTQGVYTINGKGEPTTRRFILDDTLFSASYGENYAHSDFMQNELLKKGLKSGYSVKLEKEFRVPGLKRDETYYGPVPYCDNIAKPFKVKFDKDTKEFIFGSEGMTISNPYNYPGWITHTQVKQ